MVKSPVWTALGASVRGASHERNGQKNQDAVGVKNPEGPSDFMLLAVSDGHGSTRSFRSDRGSALAIECALRIMAMFLRRLGPDAPLSRIRNQARVHWPYALITAWKQAVREDLEKNPFTFLEFAAFPEPPPQPKPGEDLPTSAYLAYGATLIAVAMTSRYIIYSQLGDGDIITAWPDGRVTRPLPRKHEFMANQTNSLCTPNAFRAFQVRVERYRADSPALVMLSTDGYANCFGNDDGFFTVGADLLGYFRAHGSAFVRDNIADWLSESSRDGSGDDITVGLAVRRGALPGA
jgi:hypothetical protein